MTTTSHIHQGPNFYNTIEECKTSIYNRRQTNPRYRGYNQTHFTAGDEEQFRQYMDLSNTTNTKLMIIPSNNIFKSEHRFVSPLYSNVNTIDVINTFRYIFHKFKKGIYVKIKDNKLSVFLPFSKANYTNEISDKLLFPPEYTSMEQFIEHIYTLEKRPFNPKKINKFVDTWICNNCLVRFEFPTPEGDSGIHPIYDMLEETLKVRKVPDIEFFVNKRDFPLLKNDTTEPYDHIYDKSEPLISHCYDKYVPILSGSSTNEFADVLIPTWEDWSRVNKNVKYFPKSTNNYEVADIAWNKKLPIAVFRGGSTGIGTTLETNPRLMVSLMSIQNPEFIDAGITNWNLRPRKIKGERYLSTIEINSPPLNKIKLVERLSPAEQCKYKYVINIDGHTTAFRLSLELSMGSVILMVDSEYKLWYSHMLKPHVHYIPVKRDLSNLIETIEWCRKNDDKCEKIAANAKAFYNKYLCIDGIHDFLQKTLIELKRTMGNGIYYNKLQPLQIQLSYESKLDSKVYILPKIVKEIFKSVNSTINLHDSSIISKVSTKQSELNHEKFIGINCTNHLLKTVQNFAYIYDYKIDNTIVMSYVNGISFLDYLEKSFVLQEYIHIILQLCLVLDIAQKQYHFVHWDLMPWNIIIKKYDKYGYIKYGDISIYTNVVPVIIDCGKSHIIHENIHYGYINMFKFSTIQDILSILLSSIYNIISVYRLTSFDFKQLITLINFITNSGFRKEPFHDFKELRSFLYQEKKFSVIINSNKYDLENKNPMHLFHYISNKLFLNKNTILYHSNLKNDCCISLASFEFTEDDFLLPEKILNLLQKYKTSFNYLDIVNVATLRKYVQIIYQNEDKLIYTKIKNE